MRSTAGKWGAGEDQGQSSRPGRGAIARDLDDATLGVAWSLGPPRLCAVEPSPGPPTPARCSQERGLPKPWPTWSSRGSTHSTPLPPLPLRPLANLA